MWCVYGEEYGIDLVGIVYLCIDIVNCVVDVDGSYYLVIMLGEVLGEGGGGMVVGIVGVVDY